MIPTSKFLREFLYVSPIFYRPLPACSSDSMVLMSLSRTYAACVGTGVPSDDEKEDVSRSVLVRMTYFLY